MQNFDINLPCNKLLILLVVPITVNTVKIGHNKQNIAIMFAINLHCFQQKVRENETRLEPEESWLIDRWINEVLLLIIFISFPN